jgi:hypothetical protein
VKNAQARAMYVVTVLQGLEAMSKLGLSMEEAGNMAEQTIAFLRQPVG